MALSESEQAILDGIERSFITYDYDSDSIERAASDMRLVRAARYVLGYGEALPDSICDAGELTAQIAEEYFLKPEEVAMAIDIAEMRVLREQA